jgi:hypothetical protein
MRSSLERAHVVAVVAAVCAAFIFFRECHQKMAENQTEEGPVATHQETDPRSFGITDYEELTERQWDKQTEMYLEDGPKNATGEQWARYCLVGEFGIERYTSCSSAVSLIHCCTTVLMGCTKTPLDKTACARYLACMFAFPTGPRIICGPIGRLKSWTATSAS